MAKEKCKGCDVEADEHPVVGVGKETVDGKQVGPWVGFPVCALCHVDPSNRKRNLKMHFFFRADAPAGIANAGSSNIGM